LFRAIGRHKEPVGRAAPSLSTDGFPAYMGPNGAVSKAFGSEIDYGIEVKRFGRDEGPVGRYRPAKCLGATRKAQIGSPDLATVGTSRIERMNLSVRHFTRRFTRSTLGFSKTFTNDCHATALFVAHYNFCRPHSSLKNGIARTPAMAAGLTDHVWTVEELMRKSTE
jgi:transposase InsO family protein